MFIKFTIFWHGDLATLSSMFVSVIVFILTRITHLIISYFIVIIINHTKFWTMVIFYVAIVATVILCWWEYCHHYIFLLCFGNIAIILFYFVGILPLSSYILSELFHYDFIFYRSIATITLYFYMIIINHVILYESYSHYHFISCGNIAIISYYYCDKQIIYVRKMVIIIYILWEYPHYHFIFLSWLWKYCHYHSIFYHDRYITLFYVGNIAMVILYFSR